MSGKAPLMREGAPNGMLACRDAKVMYHHFESANPMADLTLAYAPTSIAELDAAVQKQHFSRSQELLNPKL